MTDEQIKYMVDKFLGWHLPDAFSPDAGISFKPIYNEHLPIPMRHSPTGTNLFDAEQARQMVEHMIEGIPEDNAEPSQVLTKDAIYIRLLLSRVRGAFESGDVPIAKLTIDREEYHGLLRIEATLANTEPSVPVSLLNKLRQQIDSNSYTRETILKKLGKLIAEAHGSSHEPRG